MKKNIGSIDKILRVLIAIIFIAYGVINQSLLGLIGLIPLLTASLGICPLYSIIGISTCSIDKKIKES